MKLPQFARYWASALGANTEDLEQLAGGMNNSVFLCRSNHGSWVIKGYPCLKPGHRDRMQAEVDFLHYCAHAAPGFTPALLEVDASRRCAVMEHIRGDTYSEGYAPRAKDLDAAFRFVFKLNGNLELASEGISMHAAEGFMNLRQHMENVLGRLTGMRTEHLPNRYKAEASRLIGRLNLLAEGVSLQLDKTISAGMVEDSLSADERCVSPSDFGFHNAIRTKTGIKFIDFEFAGWDDPAKLCVDFVLQQRNPVNLRPIEVASRLFPGREALMIGRIEILTEILSLKWLCIILGILDPEKLEHIINAGCSQTEECVVSTQLKRYHDYFKVNCHISQSLQKWGVYD